MISLNNLVLNIDVVELVGLKDRSISKICFDSRKVKKNDLFIAIIGVLSDGHNFIQQAIDNGALVILCEKKPDNLVDSITYIIVKDTSHSLSIMSSNFYGNPSSKIKLVGVTGTNGKTTIVNLLYQIFVNCGYQVGIISTIENRIGDQIIDSTHTTPNSLQINRLLSQMVAAKCSFCFMEVSSHAVVQKRISFLEFDAGVFSNITHDHLDYHSTFKNYIDSKQQFFSNLSSGAFAITNKDDKNGLIMLQNAIAKKITYSLKSNSDFKSRVIENHFDGMLMEIENIQFWVKLIGQFNAYNILASFAVAHLFGIPSDEIITSLSLLKPAEGRFEVFKSHKDVFVILDYAHTDDAMSNVLKTIKNISSKSQSIITVFGCGGERDRSKRAKMTNQACLHSSKVIITKDNPRNEKQEQIVSDMLEDLDEELNNKILVIDDRSSAIKTAFALANKKDVILISGKGHEKYQDENGVKKRFDDKREIFNNLKN